MNKYDLRVQQLKAEPSFELEARGRLYVTEEELLGLEKALGHSLPPDYREFLRDYGGYAFYGVWFPIHIITRSPVSNEMIGKNATNDLIDFYGIMPGTQLDLLRYYTLCSSREVMPPTFLPIAHASGGNHYCLAIAGEEYGTVFLWYLQGCDIHPVAPSFDEFMSLLVLEDD